MSQTGLAVFDSTLQTTNTWLHEVMEEAIGDRAITPDAICLGIAGVDPSHIAANNHREAPAEGLGNHHRFTLLKGDFIACGNQHRVAIAL